MAEDDHVWPPPPKRPPPPPTNRCPNCGLGGVPEGARICPICGAPLGQKPPPTFASLCGLAGLLLASSGTLAITLPAVVAIPTLQLLIGYAALAGLGLLAFSYLAALWGGRGRR